ncbi:MAG TPA: alpha/beta fold hydrolase, partial [Mycobacterium sp.]|nr:alpha/beta fold hydrolase [Mycobacterium sp.]
APPGHLLRALEWRTGLEYLATLAAARRIADWPRGDGHPVLVIPGFLAGPFSTQLLRDVLRRLGYRVYDWGLGYNMGYRVGMNETLPARLRHIRERADGRKVGIIGWSAGGIYARELARAFPDDVRSVITLGSPFRGNHQASTAWKLWRLVNRGSEATEAVSDAALTRRAQPLSVPTTCIYSKSDGIVAWQCCTSLPAPETENVEVRSSHLGYGHNVQTLSVIADRLAQPEDCWRPFRR